MGGVYRNSDFSPFCYYVLVRHFLHMIKISLHVKHEQHNPKVHQHGYNVKVACGIELDIAQEELLQ